MLRPRIIPVLLLRKSGAVKTKQFAEPRYIGDIINAIRIFNDKMVDEIMVVDIEATAQNRGPNFEMIEAIASECFMPLGYGGGVRSVEDIARLFRIGCEKVCLNYGAVKNPSLIREAANRFGKQSIAVCIDVKKPLLGSYRVMAKNGTEKAELSLEAHLKQVIEAGAGEIIIQSIDRDGTRKGYDIELVKQVVATSPVPVIALGGAGSADDLAQAIMHGGASAAAAGSLFVFTGKHEAVLINVPSEAEMHAAFAKLHAHS